MILSIAGDSANAAVIPQTTALLTLSSRLPGHSILSARYRYNHAAKR